MSNLERSERFKEEFIALMKKYKVGITVEKTLVEVILKLKALISTAMLFMMSTTT